MNDRLFVDSIRGQGPMIIQLLPSINESHLRGWESFKILDSLLEIQDGLGQLYRNDACLSRKPLYGDLNFVC